MKREAALLHPQRQVLALDVACGNFGAAGLLPRAWFAHPDADAEAHDGAAVDAR